MNTAKPTQNTDYITVYTSTDSETEAERIADTLVKHRLAACVQISPITSHYVWQGKIETNAEFRLLIKTLARHYNAIERHILTMHSYDTPAIYALPITHIEPSFAQWVAEQSQDA